MKVALVWASPRPGSLAKKLFFRLQEAGFDIFPVNPNCESLWGISCFHSLDELPELPKGVIFMVNPQLSLQILEKVVALWIKKVWFQPWTFDDAVLEYCKAHGLSFEYEKCLLVAPLELFTQFISA